MLVGVVANPYKSSKSELLEAFIHMNEDYIPSDNTVLVEGNIG